MIWMKWLPLRFIIRKAARSQGFLDPVELIARLRSFAQPSEVGEPVELLRAGMIFHARGLINSKVIQHNLDWVWPYWIERQFDPYDNSFIPRAFSVTHINLTHRNWTAIGYPDCEELPIVDPRGMLTPFLDSWSLEGWVITDDGHCLLPSQAATSVQQQDMKAGLSVITQTRLKDLTLTSCATVQQDTGAPVCKLELTASAGSPAWLVLALRPYNPEGISFIHKINLAHDRKTWTVDEKYTIEFSAPAGHHHVSDYRTGDVLMDLMERPDQADGICDIGLVTAAALFRIDPDAETRITARIPLAETSAVKFPDNMWDITRNMACKLRCPEQRFQFLYDAAVTSLLLHSPGDVYPGPYTYKRFWFRDAAFMIHALLCLGLTDRAERVLANFPARQTPLGYFRSQEGEWDANGEVLWILHRFQLLTGRPLTDEWTHPVQKGARWIMRKRLDDDIDAPHAGLLPAGFSAEHLGPNDYYYWDDFWGIAGLHAAAALLRDRDPGTGEIFAHAAGEFTRAVDRSLAKCASRLNRPGIPASPYRRMDAGAIGSLVVGYPLQNCEPDDPRLLDCVEFLLDNCFVRGAFFQDMIHSGLNAYLTLHVAQVLLRAGDPRYLELIDTVAELATSTGQWPEAIHPLTGGGCMGDGHHVWASAEWVLMMRNCFVREEEDYLLLCGGIPSHWLEQDEPIVFGPAPTVFGVVSIRISPLTRTQVMISWEAEWHDQAPPIEVRLPGFRVVRVARGTTSIILAKESMCI